MLDLNPYDRDTPKEPFEFLFANEQVFLIRRSKYLQDRKKVMFTFSYLQRDTLLSWSRFEIKKDIENISWEEFKDFRQEDLKPTSIRVGNVHKQYKEAKQGPNQSVNR